VGDQASVCADAQQPQTGIQFDPRPLELGRTYYWRVDEVTDDQGLSCEGRSGDLR